MDQQATRTKPRSYTEDYKRQVVDLVVSSGRTPTAVAGEVGLHLTLLCRWVRQYGAGAGKAEAPRPAAAPFLKPVLVPTADQAAEIAQLRKDKPHPVGRLPAAAQLRQSGGVGWLLRFQEAGEIERVGHDR